MYVKNDCILGIGLIIEDILNTLEIKVINFHLCVFFVMSKAPLECLPEIYLSFYKFSQFTS